MESKAKEPKFHPAKLGDTYKDREGKKWRFLAYCATPSVTLEASDGERITCSVDSLWVAGLSWYRRAEAGQ